MNRAVSLDDLGAWVLKGNADRVDLAGRFASEPRVSQWCVQPSYRTRLMLAGQPVVFWASGSRAGVWGVGRLTGAAFLGDDGAWHVPLELEIVPEPMRVERAALREALAGSEVFRQPQGSNPSFLTTAQFEALRAYGQKQGRKIPGSTRPT